MLRTKYRCKETKNPFDPFDPRPKILSDNANVVAHATLLTTRIFYAPALVNRSSCSALSCTLSASIFSFSWADVLAAVSGSTLGWPCIIQASTTWLGVAPISSATVLSDLNRASVSGPRYSSGTGRSARVYAPPSNAE